MNNTAIFCTKRFKSHLHKLRNLESTTTECYNNTAHNIVHILIRDGYYYSLLAPYTGQSLISYFLRLLLKGLTV